MILTPREEPDGSLHSRRALPLLTSICLHAVVIGGIFMLPSGPAGGRPHKRVRSASPLEIVQKSRVTWLRKNDRLPKISPSVVASSTGAKRTEPDKLAILTEPPRAKHWDQFIYVPVPKVEVEKAIPSPSAVVTLLAGQVPPKPVPRKFVPPPDPPKALKPKQVDLQEPAIANQLERGLDMQAPAGLSKMDAPKPALKQFVPPPDPQRRIPPRLIDVPEGLPTQSDNPGAVKLPLPVGLPDAPRPPGRKFIPPASLAGSTGASGARGGASAAQAILVQEVPASPAQGGVPGEISAVIISVDPTANAIIIPPDGNRLSKIRSGSPPGGDQGNSSASAAGEGLVIPGVTVRGGNAANTASAAAAAGRPPVPLAASAVTPAPIPTIKPRLDTPSVSVPQRPNARRVPQQVEGTFPNRTVYCTVMPGPSGAPDWVVWFGETEMLAPGSRSIMRPPVATKTALPPADGAGAAGAKLWIVARLGKSGKLSAVSIPSGLSAKHAQDLAAEMEKWVFTPAIRNGEAVDVDLVLEARLSIDRPRL